MVPLNRRGLAIAACLSSNPTLIGFDSPRFANGTKAYQNFCPMGENFHLIRCFTPNAVPSNVLSMVSPKLQDKDQCVRPVNSEKFPERFFLSLLLINCSVHLLPPFQVHKIKTYSKNKMRSRTKLTVPCPWCPSRRPGVRRRSCTVRTSHTFPADRARCRTSFAYPRRPHSHQR